MDTAISNSVAAGVTYAVSAGNSDADAKDFSPASNPDVITVSALADSDGEPGGVGGDTCNGDQDDTLADFSNWGSTIEITAPGDCILFAMEGRDVRHYQRDQHVVATCGRRRSTVGGQWFDKPG